MNVVVREAGVVSRPQRYRRNFGWAREPTSMTDLACSVPSDCRLAGTMTLVPGAGFVEVAAMTVTGVRAGTLIVCEPPV